MSEGKNRSSLNADDRIQLRRNVIHLYVRKTANGKQPTDKLLEPGQSLFTPTGYSLNRYSARSSSISSFEPFTNCNSCPRPASIKYAARAASAAPSAASLAFLSLIPCNAPVPAPSAAACPQLIVQLDQHVRPRHHRICLSRQPVPAPSISRMRHFWLRGLRLLHLLLRRPGPRGPSVVL